MKHQLVYDNKQKILPLVPFPRSFFMNLNFVWMQTSNFELHHQVSFQSCLKAEGIVIPTWLIVCGKDLMEYEKLYTVV